MAIKRGLKVMQSGSAASMTDLMFLLLLFLLIATTLISPNALKLTLPKSASQAEGKPYTTVSVTPDLRYYVELQEIPFAQLEEALRAKLAGVESPTVALHADESVPWGEIVKVMNILKDNNYKMIAATRPK